MHCPCGSLETLENCCGPFLEKTRLPPTAEQLMRSRYSAYVLKKIDYLKETLAPESRSDFDLKGTREWAEQMVWKGLKILSKKKGTEQDKTGMVEFSATYEEKNEDFELHEVSEFRKTQSGQWLYVDGDSHVHRAGESHHPHERSQPIVRENPKIGRNDPCNCGSGKKFKKCCEGKPNL